jgi:hypothetical protein
MLHACSSSLKSGFFNSLLRHHDVLGACATPGFFPALGVELDLHGGFQVLTQSFHDHDWFLSLRWVPTEGGRWLREHWRVERW